MLKDFRNFVLRGNVIDLAVAVVIGTAFTALVTSIVDNLINPLVASVGGADVGGLDVTIIQGNESTVLDFGAVISAIIAFLITAAVVFFLVVRPLSNVAARFGPKAVKPDDVVLLEEIRDLLSDRAPGSDRGRNPQERPR